MATNAIHGKRANISITSTGGVATLLGPWLKTIGLPRDLDTVEVSHFGSSYKEYVSGLKGGTISLDGMYSSTPDKMLYGIMGTSQTFVYYPGSTAVVAGKYSKYTGAAILKSYKVNSDIAAAVTFTAELQITGTVTRSTV